MMALQFSVEAGSPVELPFDSVVVGWSLVWTELVVE